MTEEHVVSCDYTKCTRKKSTQMNGVDVPELGWYHVDLDLPTWQRNNWDFCSAIHMVAHFILDGSADQALLAHIIEGKDDDDNKQPE